MVVAKVGTVAPNDKQVTSTSRTRIWKRILRTGVRGIYGFMICTSLIHLCPHYTSTPIACHHGKSTVLDGGKSAISPTTQTSRRCCLASASRSCREPTASFPSTERTCFSTVFSLSTNALAICLLLMPLATRRSTSHSRAVSVFSYPAMLQTEIVCFVQLMAPLP